MAASAHGQCDADYKVCEDSRKRQRATTECGGGGVIGVKDVTWIEAPL
jgi:hypothetical protein